MQEALQSFPKNAWQKSLSLGLIAAIFFTSIPMPAFAATAETSFFYYHHGDHLGSTNVITEGNTSAIHAGITYAKGDIVQRFEYSPYGQESYVLNPGLDLEVSYTGQDYDVESGLYYYNSRYYNPQLGRFIQPDTIVPDVTDLQSFNRYSYVNNNPIKYNDPTGHMPGSQGYAGPVDTGGGMGGNAMNGGAGFSYVGAILSFAVDLAISSMALPSVYDGQPGFGRIDVDEGENISVKSVVYTPPPIDKNPIPSGTDGYGAVMDDIQLGLDIFGFIPVYGDIADGVNAVISLGRGNYLGAALSAVAIVPLVGSFIKVGVTGAKAVKVEVTITKRIIIGENMGRVKKAANDLGAKYYQSWGKNWTKEGFDLERNLLNNKRWIKTKMKQGYEIFDIGADGTKTAPSIFYKMETEVLEKSKYPVTQIKGY